MPYSFTRLAADKAAKMSVAQFKAEFDQIKRRSPEFSVNDMDEDSNEPLIISAARHGYVNAVKALLTDPILNVNVQDSHKRTALHYACLNKSNIQLQLIKELLRYKKQIDNHPIRYENAEISLEDEDGKKPFDYLPKDIAQQLIYPMCECGRLDAFKQLHAKGVDIDDYDPSDGKKTPLHIAVIAGHKEIVSAIIDAHPDSIHKLQDAGNTKNTVLHNAAYYYWPEIVTLLLSKGANPSLTNEAGHTPLMYAFESRDNDDASLEKLGKIIQIFADIPHKYRVDLGIRLRVTQYGETYLHIALRNRKPLRVNNYPLTEFILNQIQNGDDILNKKAGEYYKWKTPLQYTIDNNYELIPLLIKKGAKIKLDDEENPTILHYIFTSNRQVALKTMLDELLPESSTANLREELREKLVGVMAEKSKSKKQNILHLAAKGECKDLSLLLEKFDDQHPSPAFTNLMNAVDSDGNTPLYLAIKAKNKDNVIKLLKHNALTTNPKDKELAIDIAIRESSYEILRELLDSLTTIEFQHLVRNNNLKLLHTAAQIEGPEDYRGDTENKLNLLLLKIKDVKDFASLVNQEDENDNTPAHIALIHKKVRNFLVLERTKVKLDATNKAKQSVSKLREENIRLILRAQREMDDRRLAHEKTAKVSADSKAAAVKSTMRSSSGDERSGASSGLLKPSGVKEIERRVSMSGNPSSGTTTPVLAQQPISPPDNTAEALPSEPASVTPPTSTRSDMSGSEQPLMPNEPEQQKGKALEDTQGAIGEHLNGGDNPLLLTTFKRLTNYIANSGFGQHIIRNKYKYLIGGIIALLAIAGFLALCVFCPPVAAKIAVLALVMNVFIKTNLATAATAWLKPVAQAISITLPFTVPAVITVLTLGITWGVCKLNDFGNWISSKFTGNSHLKTLNNSNVDYQAVATQDVRSEQSLAAADTTALRTNMTSNVKSSESPLIIQDVSLWKRVQQFDQEYFQPIVKSLGFFCCGNAAVDDDKSDIKKAPQRTQSEEIERDKSSPPISKATL